VPIDLIQNLTSTSDGETLTADMKLQRLKSSPPSLPFDLVIEILCRLPVKHLLQLRCVCKSWNSLISDDSKFAKKHLCLSTSNQDHLHLNITGMNSSNELLLFDFSISSIFTSASTTVQCPPFTWRRSYALEVSTCDGILCVGGINGRLPFLYNPSIKKSKTLPPLKTTTTREVRPIKTLYSLVYHGFTNKYKILALTLYLNSKSEVNVHTLGTDYWRKINDFPCHRRSCAEPGIFMNDTVNWLIYDTCSSSMVIVSLDLNKELYQKLLLPLGTSSHLGATRGCLFVVSDWGQFSDLMIMKEYGNENSWTKLLRVPDMRDFGFTFTHKKALYISEDNQVLMKFIMLDKFCLLVYDSINNTFKIPTIQNINHDKMAQPEVYIESLISPSF